MRRTRRPRIRGQFAPLSYKLIDSPAWEELSGNAHSVYIKIMRQRNGYNDRNLKLPYSQIKLSSATTAKALKQLVAIGLIDVVERGGLFKKCSIYALSERWKVYETPLLPGKSIKVFKKQSEQITQTSPTGLETGATDRLQDDRHSII